MGTLRLTALSLLSGALLTTTAHATTFYIDQFQITKNGNDWFNDIFEDGDPPPSVKNEITTPPRANASLYFTRPNPMPGPEEDGKLAMDTAQGQPTTSVVTGDPLLMQRARLATNISDDPADLDNGLKTDDSFTVTGVFDLIRPDRQREAYGVRLVDSREGHEANDNLQLIVNRNLQDDWRVVYRKADFAAGEFDEFGTFDLSAVDTGFDQIGLMLSKSDADSNEISASFELIDSDDATNNLLMNLDGDPTIFNGELWTRADFFAAQVVPIPAALPLFASAIALLGLVGRRRKNTA